MLVMVCAGMFVMEKVAKMDKWDLPRITRTSGMESWDSLESLSEMSY